MPSKEGLCLTKLREIIDERYPVNRVRRMLSPEKDGAVEKFVNRHLDYIENTLRALGSTIADPQTSEASLVHKKMPLDALIRLELERIMHHITRAFIESPINDLSTLSDISGSGIYALYYTGQYELYTPNARRSSANYNQPIYIGACLPSRKAKLQKRMPSSLAGRLESHARSIRSTTNLDIQDFKFRSLILDDADHELSLYLERVLIMTFHPPWNVSITGFGNHIPGMGRQGMSLSEWDTLHPGRS